MKELKNNQAALILEISEEGEVTIDITSPDIDGIPSVICHKLAKKLLQDENFREEIMKSVEEEFED